MIYTSDNHHPVNNTNTTTVAQLTNGGTVEMLSLLTGAQIVFDDSKNAINMHFSKMVGKAGKKFKTLSVQYNAGTDSYDLKGYKLNRTTFEVEYKLQEENVYCDQLKGFCEQLTGLYFSLR